MTTVRPWFLVIAGLLLVLTGTCAAWEPPHSVEPEALTWLQQECPADFFASRPCFRQRGTERFVRRLYDAGALDVRMARLLEELAGLRISLPLAPEPRRAIIALVNKRLEECAQPPVEDTGQDEIVLWFC
ncbi:MAG: hypothetical protein ACM3L6_03220 [Deltaproteobacteria bacterium]